MRNEEIKKDLEKVLQSNRQIDDKLNDLIKDERHYRAKSTVWGMVGGALVSGLFWLFKYLIAKINMLI